jgi:hypothetical protein
MSLGNRTTSISVFSKTETTPPYKGGEFNIVTYKISRINT